MSAGARRSSKREARKAAKAKNHQPLVESARQKEPRRPVRARAKEIRPLTEAQRRYDSAIFASQLTFGIGPAGTGKTWWAAMRAGEQLRDGAIEKLIVTRPAVEAGEKLGFLPGDMNEKYDPYISPVRGALEEALGSGQLEYMIRSGAVEPSPLAYMRGATFKNCWVILDEAQNVTPLQMKLFLTRIGEGSRIIINGDPTQKDIPGPSGLIDAVRRLDGLKGVSVVSFDHADIVRSGLCQQIVQRYESSSDEKPSLARYTDRADDAGMRRTLGEK